MSALTQGLRTILAVTRFFALVYVTYLCTYLAPTHDLRRWGAATSWILIQLGPAWPAQVIRAYAMTELRDHPLIPAAGSRRWRLSTPDQAG